MGRHVLKNSEVQFAGSYQLDMNMSPASKPAASASTSKAANARIVKTNPEFALVEVTCSCGHTTLVRCEYAAQTEPVAVGSAQ